MSPSTLIQPSTPRMILASNVMVIELSRVQFVYVIYYNFECNLGYISMGKAQK